MGRILVSSSHYDTVCAEAKKYLEDQGHEVIFDPEREFPAYTKDELKRLLPDIDAAIIGMDRYDREVLGYAPRLRAVAIFVVCVENIDGEAADERVVYVLNAPGQNSCAVAELAAGTIICLLRGIIGFDGAVREGRWPRVLKTDLRGKTVGLIGFGAVARFLAERLKAFETEILAYDLYPNRSEAERIGVRLCPLDEVLQNSDIISLHVPETPETHHLIGRETIARMKDGAYLVNTARGALVDIDALAEALNGGKLAGAALDAFEYEPLPPNAPILQCRNVICTPHIGGETVDAYKRLAVSTAQDIAAVLAGEEPSFCTNRTQLEERRMTNAEKRKRELSALS